MPENKLPWRTLVTSEGPAGRFTREQIRKAIIAAELERPARPLPKRSRKRSTRSVPAPPP
jgi:hypothetical protein